MSGQGFFRIDRRTWAEICRLGMNPAVAYLVLACGTGRDNRKTAWSAQAVAVYGGMAWLRGKPAIDVLRDHGFISQTQAGSRPRYELLDWLEVKEAIKAQRPPMGPYQATIHEQIVQGKQPRSKLQRATADDLVREGRLWLIGEEYVAQPPKDVAPAEEHYIWLPNTLVCGTHAGEDPPVSRIRRYGDVLALRLLVDLYQAQHLRDDGGISRTVVYQEFEREPAGEQGIYRVWSFKQGQQYVTKHRITEPHCSRQTDGDLMFWHCLRRLQEQRLIEFVPHLCESEKPDSEMIHPYGVDWSEKGLENLENVVGQAAHYAAMEMCRPGYSLKGNAYLAPVPRNYCNVQMVGIASLHYRPHTKLTSEWWAVLQKRLPEHIRTYEALRDKAESIRLDIKGYQGESRGFNGLQGTSKM